METTEQMVIRLFKEGLTLDKIEEQLRIVVEVADEENLSESVCQGRFTVKNVLLG